MYLDKIHFLQTGVSLEISTKALRDLIRHVTDGQRIPELAKICTTRDLYDYLTVIVHQGAEGLISRRYAWVGGIKKNLLAGQPVAYRQFDELFWRNLDEEDPDGNEWYQLTSNEVFRLQLNRLLDIVRSAKRNLLQRVDELPDFNIGWA
ncbi:MAG TPA: hypothetical protein DEO56_09370 [Nitrosomonas nitrosa]|jgi:hypothetical protein|uniref:Uncharacterized protein n=1 Tax=Nitrosomonas nitrosa TaxID=52442 RepID=A0A1I4Q3M4_9PROT|nr:MULTISPECIES: hypothetical protein [Nitrosomonas]MCO6435236.1 hypothetical protein [Nitrosomonas nitrosa]MCW5601890.1 hypothetical protein [Nitrosomonas sp.]PTQ97502.1 hypothetical protein C8R30_11181 [Nitrosomonas nitrosa]CAE6514328.1 conserved hypothetical protein [Nitrosomonas nitrosa]SFM34255.1 hypothetical protein SAMN05421880_11380 [Nitrosomonas nitrosa]